MPSPLRTAPAGFFQGRIDEARIWNVVRTGADPRATRIYELTSGTGLVGRWGLDEGTGATTVADSTASPITGTLAGTPLRRWIADEYAFPQDTTAPGRRAGCRAPSPQATTAIV